jgi:hypothetical protein
MDSVYVPAPVLSLLLIQPLAVPMRHFVPFQLPPAASMVTVTLAAMLVPVLVVVAATMTAAALLRVTPVIA